jgi:hypothetical protein
MLDAPTYARTQDIIEAEVGGEVVLLHTQSWQYFEFDRTGATIWALLTEPRSLDTLVEALTAQFDVERGRCATETKAFLDEMIEQGLVTANSD